MKILMYHSIGGKGSGETGSQIYSLSAERFEAQLAYLAQNDFTVLEDPLPEACYNRAVMLTFDDGLLDNYTYALALLKKFSIKGVFFIIPTKVGLSGYMNWEQIREMRSLGMVIGSHGMTHRILTRLAVSDIRYELCESKYLIEQNLGEKVPYFSVPRGFFDARVVNIARAEGYKAVFTSEMWNRNNFCFGRIAVKKDWELKKFIRVVTKGLPIGEKSAEYIKAAAKKFIGPGAYDKTRSRLLARQKS